MINSYLWYNYIYKGDDLHQCEVLLTGGKDVLVKYKSRDDKFVNIGFKTEGGFIIPIRPVVSKHYYQLLELAQEVVITYSQEKGGK